ncbi:hypothetical protein [Amnibacterium setariae]|uniref:Uncharacterized protein n=1 Tax=Amnibacterium setariae TaxID=2306585 RepID=A0A3A1U138_9MICO|nr:hypothetical protein [Amnibacterium setariae]RIX28645.1 hypothetical protein D1781_14670 [Amnibacterium setariae]
MFRDPDGVSGGGGVEPGTVHLGMMQPGKWTVYAVCNNIDLLHLQIRSAGKTQAETDIPCGVTIAIPVTVTAAGARDFAIATSYPKGADGPAWWSAQVNSTTWRQTQSFSFK